MSDIKKTDQEEKGNPNKVYKEELAGEGGGLFDTDSESAARDQAKIRKASAGHGQKMDSVHEDDLMDSEEDGEAIERQREIEEKE